MRTLTHASNQSVREGRVRTGVAWLAVWVHDATRGLSTTPLMLARTRARRRRRTLLPDGLRDGARQLLHPVRGDDTVPALGQRRAQALAHRTRRADDEGRLAPAKSGGNIGTSRAAIVERTVQTGSTPHTVA